MFVAAMLDAGCCDCDAECDVGGSSRLSVGQDYRFVVFQNAGAADEVGVRTTEVPGYDAEPTRAEDPKDGGAMRTGVARSSRGALQC